VNGTADFARSALQNEEPSSAVNCWVQSHRHFWSPSAETGLGHREVLSYCAIQLLASSTWFLTRSLCDRWSADRPWSLRSKNSSSHT